jgi:hypothetical protein
MQGRCCFGYGVNDLLSCEQSRARQTQLSMTSPMSFYPLSMRLHIKPP